MHFTMNGLLPTSMLSKVKLKELILYTKTSQTPLARFFLARNAANHNLLTISVNAKLAGCVKFSQSIKDSIDSLGKQGRVFALWAHGRGFLGLEGSSGRQPGLSKQWFQSETNKRPPHAPGRDLLN